MLDVSDMSDLNEEQQTILQNFSEITNITDMNLCRSILFQNNWNLETAVDRFIRNRDIGEIDSSFTHTSDGDNSRGVENVPAQRHQRSGNNVFDLFGVALRWVFQIFPESLTPEQDASRFCGDFKIKYGEDSPQFQPLSYNQAVSEAYRESKFLLVYLHSPLHDDTDRFCRQVLCSEGVLRLFNSNDILLWGGQVWDPEAYNLSMQLKVSTFPFLALMLCESERSVQIVDRIQGNIEPRILLERLQTCMNQSRGHLMRARNAQRRREEEVSLRAEQDREFEEAMESDRRMQEERRREMELQAKQAEEEQQRRELEEAIALSEELERESQLSRDRDSLSVRSEPSTPESTALIRFQLPHGIKVSRKFWRDDTVEMLYAFLRVHFADTGSGIAHFMISTNFPKKDLTDKSATLEAEGLFPRGALFVQDLDA